MALIRWGYKRIECCKMRKVRYNQSGRAFCQLLWENGSPFGFTEATLSLDLFLFHISAAWLREYWSGKGTKLSFYSKK